ANSFLVSGKPYKLLLVTTGNISNKDLESHPPLGDAQPVADLLQRHALRVVVPPRPHPDDLPLPRAQVLRQAVDPLLGLLPAGQALLLVKPVARRRLEDLLVARPVSVVARAAPRTYTVPDERRYRYPLRHRAGRHPRRRAAPAAGLRRAAEAGRP